MNKIYYVGPICYIAHSRMVEWLRDRGFLPIGTRPDLYNPSYIVWLYKTSDELLEVLNDYEENRGHGRPFHRKPKSTK